MSQGFDEPSQPKSGPPRRRRAPNAPPSGPATFALPASSTISDYMRQKIRQQIISMALVPGTPISEKEIALREGVSRTPVREAVLRLAEEKLVEVVPKSGTFVARIPLSALPEALVIRKALEEVTVRAATALATPADFLELRAILQRQTQEAEAGDVQAFHLADEDFHAHIAQVGRYSGIWDLIQQVKVQVDRYRRLTLPQTGRMRIVIEEHTAVLDAMEAGDADRATKCMSYHLEKLKLDIEVFRDQWPDYFIHDIKLNAETLR